MDCGPASLKALLEGFGIPVSYGRLREACQTGVDGTSVDTLEVAAQQLGLEATQIMLPADHLLAPQANALPALVVVRQPSGQAHFVVVWKRHGSWLQLMDPAVGRRWTRANRFLDDLFLHAQPVPSDAWAEWAATAEFRGPLAARIERLGGSAPSLIEAAGLARADAATRMVESLASRGALKRGVETSTVLERIASSAHPIPSEYWSAEPVADDPSTVVMRGAVLLKVTGTRASSAVLPELAAALSERPTHPMRELLGLISQLPALTVAGALAIAAAAVVLEAVLLRGFFDLGDFLTQPGARAGAVSLLLAFSVLLLALEFSIMQGVLWLGRGLEAKLRLAFLKKLPRLEDRYLQSRPISDMGDRSHNVHLIRNAPLIASRFLRALLEIAITVAAIAWFYPAAAVPALLLAVVAVGVPLAAQPLLAERDLRMRTHSGALTRFYMDALLGLTAIRAHRGAAAVQYEQGMLLAEWARSGLSLQRAVVLVEALQITGGFALAGWTVWSQMHSGAATGGLLLLAYWILNLPSLGQDAATAAWQYPMLRNTAMRLTEPLGAPEAPFAESDEFVPAPSISLQNVTVQASGHTILDDVSLEIAAGTHVAIVGASGAGKSSLVGLLLGWHCPSGGTVSVDGRPLDAQLLHALRRVTAWVDPQVQLWNRTLVQNLRYGAPESAVDEVLEQAELRGVVSRLPQGLETALGEGGALVSGGEGQRVRMGRAMGRSLVSLGILDEPARGLDRERRRGLVTRARERWHSATLICISHDVEDTRSFDRVVVMDGGRIVEDGEPETLAADPGSRYRSLLNAESDVRQGLWASANWRRLRLSKGELKEEPGRPVRG